LHPFLTSLLGGAIIGLSAALLMFLSGRIAGISGMIAGAVMPYTRSDALWRIVFIIGLVLGPVVLGILTGGNNIAPPVKSNSVMVVAGLLVGVGAMLGGGCTSGHGICGLSRLSYRSIVSTFTFMGFAGLTVFVARHLI